MFRHLLCVFLDWSAVLFEKPIVAYRVKKFPAFHGILRFITVFARAHQWNLP
jgi:hypothetical protein